MSRKQCSLPVILRRGLLFLPGVLLAFSSSGSSQIADRPLGAAIGKTLRDLGAAKRTALFSQFQQQYYDRACKHLQNMNDSLQKYEQIDGPTLNEAIREVKFIADRAPLQEASRVLLKRDVENLRREREP